MMKRDIFQPIFDAGITDTTIIREIVVIALATIHDRQLADHMMDLSMLNDDGLTRVIQQKIGGR